MGFKALWEETKEKVQKGWVTSLYVSNVLSVDVETAECLMEDWMKLLEYEVNNELQEELNS